MSASGGAPVPLSVFGLGYVGAVTAACFARLGHRVTGVETHAGKVDLINAGRSPIVERELAPLLASAVEQGLLKATGDALEGVRESAVSLVCVGTPGGPDGSIDLRFVTRVCAEIGQALREKSGFHIVAIRSTVLPGTTRAVLVPILEQASGKRAGADFGVAFHPEFLREGAAVDDFFSPSRCIVGVLDDRSAEVVAGLCRRLPTPAVVTTLEAAELIKYADNAWHALKICFANEVGTLAATAGVDGRFLMDLFCQDAKLNLSPRYLRPGFAFGGSCLPKDVNALAAWARSHGVAAPVLEAILPSNIVHLQRVIEAVRRTGARTLGLVGLTFKAGTDDVRESPGVKLMEALIGEGVEVLAYDENIAPGSLIGANRQYLLDHVPDCERRLRVNVAALASECEVLVVLHDTASYRDAVNPYRGHKVVIDVNELMQSEDFPSPVERLNQTTVS